MSKVIKGIGKAVKKIGKAVKKFASSKVGKALLIAATVYVGGAALGAWNSPFTSINGVLAGGAKESVGSQILAAGEGTASAAGVSGGAAGTATQVAGGTMNLGGAGAGGATSAGAGTQVAGGTMNLGSMAAPAGQAATGVAAPSSAGSIATAAAEGARSASAIGEIAAGAEKTGIISKIMSGAEPALDFMKKNPMPSAMMLSAAGSAAAPDEIDIIKERQRQAGMQEQREIDRREKNMNLAGIQLNMRPTGNSLTDTRGNSVYGTGGIINRSRGVI